MSIRKEIIGKTPANINTLDTEVVVPLKHQNNFWRSLDLPLINCEIELDLPWSRNCVISEISRTAAVAVNPSKSVTFQIISAKIMSQ